MKKTVTLIIAIMIMLILAVLGTTILMMQSADFEMNLGSLDSERALYLAESGAEWMLRELTQSEDAWPVKDTWYLHGMDFGEYEVRHRDPVSGVGKEDMGDIIVESIGYIPSKNNFRARREVKIVIVIGNVDKVIQAKNYFDWSALHANSDIDGDIVVGRPEDGALGYEGDGDATHNEVDIDYGAAKPPGSGSRTFIPQDTYVEIDMDFFRTNAKLFFPDPLSRVITATLSYVSGDTIGVNDANFFDDMDGSLGDIEGNAVRNLDVGGWIADSWKVIESVPGGFNKRRVRLNEPVEGIWEVGDQIRLVKRFHETINFITTFFGSTDRYWYVASDVIVDSIDPDNSFWERLWCGTDSLCIWYTSLIATGDIIITGDNRVNMRAHWGLPSWPLFATENGNLISYAPASGSEYAKMRKRRFYGLMYSENGDVSFDYLYCTGWSFFGMSRGGAIMGNNVYLDGRIEMDYSDFWIDPEYGLEFKSSGVYWQER